MSTTPVGDSATTTVTDRASARVPGGRAAVAGALAAAVALGVGELLSGLLTGAASLVVEIGDQVINLAPGPVERAAIETVGTADKPLLLTSIVGLSLLFGSLLGRLAARRFVLGAAGIAAFALLGVLVALLDDRVRAVPTAVVGIAAAAAGIGVLRRLLSAARPVHPLPTPMRGAHSRIGPDGVDRRGFLRVAMTAALVASASAVAGKVLAGRDRVSAIRAAITLPLPRRRALPVPAAAELGIPGLTPVLVPNADFYRIDTALTVPQVDTDSWSLRISGKVDRPLQFSYDELLAMPHIEADVTLSCVSNEVGGTLVGNARWQGVSLRELLDRAGVQAGGTQIVGRSVEGFTAAFPTAIGMQQANAMVAIAMNGEPLPARHGFPARLVIPGVYGYVSATKWLKSIELVGDSFEGYWIPRGWSKLGPVKTQSRIDVPGGRSVKAGRTPVAGVAWAPTRGIERVEVQVDDGPWQQARLADSLGVDTWRQWVYEWDATPGRHRIAVRATDGAGDVQPAERSEVAPDGATGHHTITVEVDA